MQESPQDRESTPALQTLESLDENYKKFVDDGADTKQAGWWLDLPDDES